MQMSELGAANYAKRLAPGKDLISQREAYRQFGEARVKDWERRGLINGKIRSGSASNSKILYSIAELLSIETANKLTYFVNR